MARKLVMMMAMVVVVVVVVIVMPQRTMVLMEGWSWIRPLWELVVELVVRGERNVALLSRCRPCRRWGVWVNRNSLVFQVLAGTSLPWGTRTPNTSKKKKWGRTTRHDTTSALVYLACVMNDISIKPKVMHEH